MCMPLCAGKKLFEDECKLAKERGIVWRPHVAYIYKNDDKNEDRLEKRFRYFWGHIITSLTFSVGICESKGGRLGFEYSVLQLFHCKLICRLSTVLLRQKRKGKENELEICCEKIMSIM